MTKNTTPHDSLCNGAAAAPADRQAHRGYAPVGGQWRFGLSAALAIALAACATNSALEQSRRDFASGDRMHALQRLERAVKEDPANAELRSYYIRQRELLVKERLAAAERSRSAGRAGEAATLYRDVLAIEPDNARARLGLDELDRGHRRRERVAQARNAFIAGDLSTATRLVRGVLAEAADDRVAQELWREIDERVQQSRKPQADALQGAMAKPVTLEFRDAPLRVVFEALSRASGLNFVFDRDVRTESRVTLFVRETTVDEVIRLLAATQGIDRKLLNANSILVYPATTAKQREHLELVTRSFYLANTDAKSAQAMVKQLAKTRDVFIDEKLNLLVVKDTPDAVRMIERLVATLDVPEPEVMLELEVLEISRNKLLDLGIEFPEQIGYGLLTPDIPAPSQIVDGVVISGTTQLGGKLLDGNINLRKRDDLVPFISNPGLVLRLRSEDGDSSILANPRIRVRNRDKAKIHIGDKLPVFTTTSTANVGVSASVSYLDVGLKLEVEPSVYRDDEVGIKINLEVSNIVKEVPGPTSSLAYQVGTRTATTALRLRDGETQVLAGLINDEDRSAAQRLPGLGNLPVLGRLFSAQRDAHNKTEIVLLVTPRILRNVMPPVALLADMPAGTEANVGAEPLRLGRTAPGSLSLRGEGGGAVPASARAAPEPTMPAAAPAPAEPGNASQPADAADGPAVGLVVPDRMRRNDIITARIHVEQLLGVDSAEVTVTFDADRLEAEGAVAPGTIRVPVDLLDGKGDVTVRLKGRPDMVGLAGVVVTGLTVRRGEGEERIPLSVPATVQIVE